MAQTFIGYPVITQTGINLAIGAASVTGTIPLMSSGQVPRFVRISAQGACCFRMFPTAGGSAVNTDTQVQPGDSLIIAVPDGFTKISVIQQGAGTGAFQVSPLENM
jgi:hypothetical protein